MVKRDSSLQRMHFQCSRVQWWRALPHSSQRLALRMVILVLWAAAQPWKPISWSSRRTVLVLTLIFTHYSTPQFRSVSLCGLPLHGWAIVAPRHSHFTITALTVDRDSSSMADIWQTDLLERWPPMTVPSWKSLSSSVRLFYCQCLSMEIAWPCGRLYTSVSNGCGWNSSIHSFEGVSTYFCVHSVYLILNVKNFLWISFVELLKVNTLHVKSYLS
jgi:hypothetical protein